MNGYVPARTAEFECEKGHRFWAPAAPEMEGLTQVTVCPTCHQAWLQAQFGAKQVSTSRKVGATQP